MDYYHGESRCIIYLVFRTSYNNVNKKIFWDKVTIISATQTHTSINMVRSNGKRDLYPFHFSALEHLIRKQAITLSSQVSLSPAFIYTTILLTRNCFENYSKIFSGFRTLGTGVHYPKVLDG